MKKEIIIIGAGPSGLSVALFLSQRGYRPRIIDKKSEVSKYSKALGVNPRTLTLMEEYGVTDRFLANGRKMHAVNLWKGDKHIYKNDLSSVKHKYPFMLIQPQKASEEILLEELQKRNISVEYDSEFIEWQGTESGYSVTANGGINANSHYDYIIGADGGHSNVRKQLGIESIGYRYDQEWELYDIELNTKLDPDEGHIRLFSQGGMIMIRLKANIWRVAGNMNSLLDYLPPNTEVGQIHWESNFRINHKVASQLSRDNIALIGDAAHLHSPVGARGMNLGIEDAYIVSHLISENRLNEYDGLRRKYLLDTVNRINNITMAMAGSSLKSKIIRNQIGNLKMIFPIVMPQVRKFIMGLN